ncbi:B-type flagellin [Bacillota bacterium]
MIINHNIAALNTYNKLTANNAATQKSLGKLSSGLRINTAADDAAGLSISEKMRGQIRGLDQASRNAMDGISLVQTAEGALNETHSILQRMRELSVQSATDTNTSNDRAEIQKEIDQLAIEITRIANDTEFNTQKLLNGAVTASNMGETTFHIGANSGQSVSVGITAMDAKSLGISRDIVASATGTADTGTANIASSAFAGEFGTGIVDGAVLSFNYDAAVVPVSAVAAEWNSGAVAVADDATETFVFNGVTVSITKAAAGAAASVTGANAVSVGVVNGANADTTATAIISALNTYKASGAPANDALDNFTFGGDGTGITITGTLADGDANNALAITGNAVAGAAGPSVNGVDAVAARAARVTISSTVGHTQTVNVAGTATSLAVTTGNFKGMTLNLATDVATDLDGAATLTLAATSELASAAQFAGGALTDNAVTKAGLDVSTRAFANDAIGIIDNAISTVSSERAKLGSVQNRLEYTINNLKTTSENLTSSESQIRDVDMAKEMMAFTKNNIISQAAQAMLAQANMMPQGVLQLLQ